MPMMRWRWTLLILCGLLLTTSLPQIVGVVRAGSGQHFLAPIQSSPADVAAYYSNIEQARQGRILFANQLTSEAQTPTFFHPLWLAVGWFARLTNVSTPMAFFLARLAAVVLFVILMRMIISKIFSQIRQQYVALIVLTTSSGLGWMFADRLYNGQEVLRAPIDTWVAESNTFQTLAHSAQFILAQIAVVMIVWAWYQWTQGRRTRYDRWVGSIFLVLGCVHPYDVVTTLVIVGTWWLVAWHQQHWGRARVLASCWWLIRTGAWLFPVLLYYVVGPLSQPAMAGWFRQNITPAPKIEAVIFGFGLLVPLALVGIFRHRRWQQPIFQLLIVWLFVCLALCYVPTVAIARRFLGTVHIPLALLATAGLLEIVEALTTRRWSVPLTTALVLLLALTNGKVLQADIQEILQPQRAQEPMYVSSQYIEAANWLRAHSTLNQVVLGTFWDENTLAGMIGRPTVFAHPNQTVESWNREKDWQRLISNQISDTDRSLMLRRLRVTWLWWTSDDERHGQYRPADDARWRLQYRTTGISIYRLQ